MTNNLPGFGSDLQRSFVSEEIIKLPLKVRWKSEKFPRDYAVRQPAVDGERIYHIYHREPPLRSGLCAHDRKTGKRLWEFLFEDFGGSHQICCGAGRVFYSENGHIGCADGTTGDILWRVNPPELIRACGVVIHAPLYCDGVIYASGSARNICALNAEDGSVLWCFEGLDFGPVSLYRNRLYFTSYRRDDSNYLYCLDLTGNLLWQSDITEIGRYERREYDKEWKLVVVSYPGAYGGVVTIWQGKIFFPLGDTLSAFDAETGKLLWQTPGYFWEQPVSDGKRVYFFNGETLTAYDAETGTVVYQTAEVPDAYRIPIGGGAGKSLLTANNILLSGSKNRIFAFDTETGEILWQFSNKKSSGSLYLQPLLHDGFLYVIDSSSHLYCFEPKV